MHRTLGKTQAARILRLSRLEENINAQIPLLKSRGMSFLEQRFFYAYTVMIENTL